MKNLELMKLRARATNNDRQHERMVRDKLRSLHRALLYSYQTTWIKKDGDDNAEYVRALINPDRVKFDYDEKTVSVDPRYGFKCGDTFEWQGTNTHWIILKQELTEIAYFRANIRRCQLLEVVDPDTKEKVSLWVAVRGPVETKINTIQKAGIVADVPNLTLNVYLTLTEQTRRIFDRYFRFEFAGRYWQVNAADWISTPGILEFTAQENYNCDHDELIVQPIDPNPVVDADAATIVGETFVKPLQAVVFEATQNIPEWKWSVSLASDRLNAKDVIEITTEDNVATVTWCAMVSGSYTLHYGDLTKTVVVESLF